MKMSGMSRANLYAASAIVAAIVLLVLIAEAMNVWPRPGAVVLSQPELRQADQFGPPGWPDSVGNASSTAQDVQRRADAGDAAAQTELGRIYADADGVEQDDEQALKWFTAAALQGDETAQFRLGVIYRDGHGVAVDYVAAYKWFSLAMDGGYLLAALQRSNLVGAMSGTEIAEAEILIRDFAAARRGGE